MKQLISLVILAGFVFSSHAYAAKAAQEVKAPTKISKAESKKSKKSKKSKVAKVKKDKWNKVCRDLLDNSVKSTLKLEKAVNKKAQVSKEEFDEKIHNELLVVQLNAWVCALSVNEQKSVSAEELFLKDYSKLVQTKKL